MHRTYFRSRTGTPLLILSLKQVNHLTHLFHPDNISSRPQKKGNKSVPLPSTCAERLVGYLLIGSERIGPPQGNQTPHILKPFSSVRLPSQTYKLELNLTTYSGYAWAESYTTYRAGFLSLSQVLLNSRPLGSDRSAGGLRMLGDPRVVRPHNTRATNIDLSPPSSSLGVTVQGKA